MIEKERIEQLLLARVTQAFPKDEIKMIKFGWSKGGKAREVLKVVQVFIEDAFSESNGKIINVVQGLAPKAKVEVKRPSGAWCWGKEDEEAIAAREAEGKAERDKVAEVVETRESKWKFDI